MLISAKLAPVFAYDELERFWRDADELGFYAVWNYDHFYGLGGSLSEQAQPTLEGWTTLAAMAKVVRRARIGCMVTGVTYRHPAVLANMAVAVDHISGGRLEFGIGAAWHQPEHEAYGIPFPRDGERVAMLDEALSVIKGLWTTEKTTFTGRYFNVTDAMCEPKPVQQPHIPIVVGANKPKMLLLTAKHADEWNAVSFVPDSWIAQNAQLDQACEDVGRNPKEVKRSVQLFLHPTQEGQVEQQLELLPRYEDAGCEHAVLSFYQPPSRALLERCAPK